MNQLKHESENKMKPKGQIDSPSTDECSSGLPVAARAGVLKKGPWTSAEDKILTDYVNKHGEGNWNAVQKHSGLSRCGKSCRLRWANHLRPNLKKGAITPEEERVIIELHSRMGNKWARMAGYLPGRTDNEIKNYWNTRIKRRQRANLPLYPFDASNKILQSQGSSQFSSIDKHHNEGLQGNTYDTLPDVIFDNHKDDQGTFSCAELFPDISASSMQTQGFGFMNPTGNHIKRFREPETLPGFHGSLPGGYLTFEQFSTGPPEKNHWGFGLPYPYDPDPSSKNLAPFGGAIHGSHALLNGNLSTSSPHLGTSKLELPSLQYSETGLSSWLECPSPCPLEEGGNFIQPPLAAEPVPSDFVLPRKSGLLQDLVHESHAINSTNNQTSEKSLNSSVFMPNDMVESSGPKLSEAEWGECKDPISPLGLNAASVFSETPPISVSSLDEFLHSKPISGSEFMLANAEHVSSVGELKCPTQPDFPNPDAFLEPNWLDESSEGVKEHTMFNNALATLLDDDYCSEYKDIPSGAATSSIAQELGLESYPWNNMPRVCQMSEIP